MFEITKQDQIEVSLTLLHSERPKLYGVLAILSAIGLKLNGHNTFPGETTLSFPFLPPYEWWPTTGI